MTAYTGAKKARAEFLSGVLIGAYTALFVLGTIR